MYKVLWINNIKKAHGAAGVFTRYPVCRILVNSISAREKRADLSCLSVKDCRRFYHTCQALFIIFFS